VVDHDPWVGDTPYFLLLNSMEPNEAGALGFLVLDVDKPDWQTEYKEWLQRSAEWYLCEKDGEQRAVLAQVVYRGEHPYYVKRHVGQIKVGSSEHRSTVAYGIGKRVPAVREGRKLVKPERTDRIWLLPGNVVCGGEDVEVLAMNVVNSLEWQEAPDAPPEE
jgi:hypothetical protein